MAALEIPSYLTIFQAAINVSIFAVMSLVVFSAILRARLTDLKKWRFGVTLAVIGFGWLLLTTGLSVSGVFLPGAFGQVSAIPPAILLPILLFSFALTRSNSAVAVLESIPLDWLIRIQFLRVMGGIFLVLYLDGFLPGVFALPAGLGDVATGLLALPVAYLVGQNSPWARSSALAWSIFGILDLVIAVSLGFLSSPGPFQKLAFENPNGLVGQYPLVMIPVFAVPLFLILHFLTLRKLAREGIYVTAS